MKESRASAEGRGHILIIEDDQAIAELERDYLGAAGFESDIEGDGERGLERGLGRAPKEEGIGAPPPYDLFIVDLMLPGMDGFEICRQLRDATERPIIVVSARSSDRDKIRALGIGIDDYLSKPFSPAELVARAKAHLARHERLVALRPGAASARILSRGDLEIDLDRKSVSVKGVIVSLTATEFAILSLLASSPGRVYARDEIFEAIRGAGTFGDLSTITVHMRRLREKIEEDPSSPGRLVTVWGMGYRLGD